MICRENKCAACFWRAAGLPSPLLSLSPLDLQAGLPSLGPLAQRALCAAGWQAKCLWNVSAACGVWGEVVNEMLSAVCVHLHCTELDLLSLFVCC